MISSKAPQNPAYASFSAFVKYSQYDFVHRLQVSNQLFFDEIRR